MRPIQGDESDEKKRKERQERKEKGRERLRFGVRQKSLVAEEEGASF
jgi:hypothetical protein